MRQTFSLPALLAFFFAMCWSSSVFAAPRVSLKKPSFFGGSYTYALNGYDTTTYWSGRLKKGKKAFKYRYRGVTWLFASAANKDKFKANPQKYAPQYGNYCAWAIADGSLAAGDPTVWSIVNGKLYLNYNKGIRKKWEKKPASFIKKANSQWPSILNK
ncbi:MAG: YHS domain-containing (seleno)protein [Spirochaetota bacterium]